VKSDVSKFMRRLRKRLWKEHDQAVRFYACGEYGDKWGRPHLHVCLFGWDFPDKQHTNTTERGHKLMESEELGKVWTKGAHQIGELTFESAAYVARYVMKKINGEKKDEHYAVTWKVDKETGEVTPHQSLEPEFNTMSRRPGIGQSFFEKHKDTIYRDDGVIVNERMTPPPKYYDRLYEVIDPRHMEEIKEKREQRADRHKENNSDKRLKVRKRLLDLRSKQLARDLG